MSLYKLKPSEIFDINSSSKLAQNFKYLKYVMRAIILAGGIRTRLFSYYERGLV